MSSTNIDVWGGDSLRVTFDQIETWSAELVERTSGGDGQVTRGSDMPLAEYGGDWLSLSDRSLYVNDLFELVKSEGDPDRNLPDRNLLSFREEHMALAKQLCWSTHDSNLNSNPDVDHSENAHSFRLDIQIGLSLKQIFVTVLATNRSDRLLQLDNLIATTKNEEPAGYPTQLSFARHQDTYGLVANGPYLRTPMGGSSGGYFYMGKSHETTGKYYSIVPRELPSSTGTVQWVFAIADADGALHRDRDYLHGEYVYTYEIFLLIHDGFDNAAPPAGTFSSGFQTWNKTATGVTQGSYVHKGEWNAATSSDDTTLAHINYPASIFLLGDNAVLAQRDAHGEYARVATSGRYERLDYAIEQGPDYWQIKHRFGDDAIVTDAPSGEPIDLDFRQEGYRYRATDRARRISMPAARWELVGNPSFTGLTTSGGWAYNPLTDVREVVVLDLGPIDAVPAPSDGSWGAPFALSRDAEVPERCVVRSARQEWGPGATVPQGTICTAYQLNVEFELRVEQRLNQTALRVVYTSPAPPRSSSLSWKLGDSDLDGATGAEVRATEAGTYTANLTYWASSTQYTVPGSKILADSEVNAGPAPLLLPQATDGHVILKPDSLIMQLQIGTDPQTTSIVQPSYHYTVYDADNHVVSQTQQDGVAQSTVDLSDFKTGRIVAMASYNVGKLLKRTEEVSATFEARAHLSMESEIPSGEIMAGSIVTASIDDPELEQATYTFEVVDDVGQVAEPLVSETTMSIDAFLSVSQTLEAQLSPGSKYRANTSDGLLVAEYEYTPSGEWRRIKYLSDNIDPDNREVVVKKYRPYTQTGTANSYLIPEGAYDPSGITKYTLRARAHYIDRNASEFDMTEQSSSIVGKVFYRHDGVFDNNIGSGFGVMAYGVAYGKRGKLGEAKFNTDATDNLQFQNFRVGGLYYLFADNHALRSNVTRNTHRSEMFQYLSAVRWSRPFHNKGDSNLSLSEIDFEATESRPGGWLPITSSDLNLQPKLYDTNGKTDRHVQLVSTQSALYGKFEFKDARFADWVLPPGHTAYIHGQDAASQSRVPFYPQYGLPDYNIASAVALNGLTVDVPWKDAHHPSNLDVLRNFLTSQGTTIASASAGDIDNAIREFEVTEENLDAVKEVLKESGELSILLALMAHEVTEQSLDHVKSAIIGLENDTLIALAANEYFRNKKLRITPALILAAKTLIDSPDFTLAEAQTAFSKVRALDEHIRLRAIKERSLLNLTGDAAFKTDNVYHLQRGTRQDPLVAEFVRQVNINDVTSHHIFYVYDRDLNAIELPAETRPDEMVHICDVTHIDLGFPGSARVVRYEGPDDQGNATWNTVGSDRTLEPYTPSDNDIVAGSVMVPFQNFWDHPLEDPSNYGDTINMIDASGITYPLNVGIDRFSPSWQPAFLYSGQSGGILSVIEVLDTEEQTEQLAHRYAKQAEVSESGSVIKSGYNYTTGDVFQSSDKWWKVTRAEPRNFDDLDISGSLYFTAQ